MTVSLRVMKSRRVVFTVASCSACVFVLSVRTESVEYAVSEPARAASPSAMKPTRRAILSRGFMGEV